MVLPYSRHVLEALPLPLVVEEDVVELPVEDDDVSDFLDSFDSEEEDLVFVEDDEDVSDWAAFLYESER